MFFNPSDGFAKDIRTKWINRWDLVSSLSSECWTLWLKYSTYKLQKYKVWTKSSHSNLRKQQVEDCWPFLLIIVSLGIRINFMEAQIKVFKKWTLWNTRRLKLTHWSKSPFSFWRALEILIHKYQNNIWISWVKWHRNSQNLIKRRTEQFGLKLTNRSRTSKPFSWILGASQSLKQLRSNALNIRWKVFWKDKGKRVITIKTIQQLKKIPEVKLVFTHSTAMKMNKNKFPNPNNVSSNKKYKQKDLMNNR